MPARVVTVVAAALLLAACSRQEADWSRTRASDSVAAYQQYLDDYPHGAHAREAAQRMKDKVDEREWQRALRLDTPEAYQVYLGGHPEGHHAAEARDRLADFMLARTPPGGDADTEPAPPAEAVAADDLPAMAARVDSTPSRAVEPPPAPTGVRGPSGTLEALAAGAGEFRVQLGAYSSERLARAAWERLVAAQEPTLGRLSPRMDPIDRDGQTLWRLQAGPLAEARARAACAELVSRGADCLVVRAAAGRP